MSDDLTNLIYSKWNNNKKNKNQKRVTAYISSESYNKLMNISCSIASSSNSSTYGIPSQIIDKAIENYIYVTSSTTENKKDE